MKKITHYAYGRIGLLLVAMLLCVAQAGAVTFTYDGINYKSGTGASAKDLTIQKYTIDKTVTPADTLFYSGDIVIPETIDYEGETYTVVATAANSFLDCKDLTSVQLPATCVTIARNTFKGCTSLSTSPLPSTVTSVGSGVFNGCTSLAEVTIPVGWAKPISEEFANCPGLKKIVIESGSTALVMNADAFGKDDNARVAMRSVEEIYLGRDVDASPYANNMQPFHNMTALRTLTIGGSTTQIASTMFQGATSLTQVNFEADNLVSAIGSSAFAACTSLPAIALPAAVTVVEQSTFSGDAALTRVTMGDNVTSIGVTAFYGTGLKSIVLPAALTTIGQSAFAKSQLEGELVLPANVTTVGSQAFAETRLTSVTISAGVTLIGAAALAPIPTLQEIVLNEGNTAFKLKDGVLLSADETRLLVSAHEGDLATSFANANVTTVDAYGLAFAPFTSVDLPALTTLGNYAFAQSDLEAFTLDAVVTTGQNVFEGSALKTLVIGEGRHEIPQGLCANCEQLQSVTLPESATSIMRNSFVGCTALKHMEIPANVNYMEPGSVPATIESLRVLNVNTPALAAGVFSPEQSNVTCQVATASVEAYKAASQWCYLNIVGDATIEGEGASLGCPTGLYFATTDGRLMYKAEDGTIVDTEFNAGLHAFTLQSYKNRIYVAVAGERFTYQDPTQPLGDGELFYVNNTNGIFYRVTVLNNVGYAPSEDPFTMYIDSTENKIYISDRNVGIHELDADTTGLYGSQPFLLQNQWLPFYNDYISWGSITGGFTRDSHGIFWMSKKYNGVGMLRFTKDDIYPDGNITGKPVNYKKLFADVIIKTFYLDEANGYLYMHVMKDPYGAVPGIYRIALSMLEDTVTGADAPGAADLKIADCELLDDSPVVSESSTNESSGELANVAQLTGDGDYVYWGYIPPKAGESAIAGSIALDESNPLHKAGIKCIAAKPLADGTMPTTVQYAVEDVEAYGIAGATYVAPDVPDLKGDVNGDGHVTIADANMVISIILNGSDSVEAEILARADVNGDGLVTIADANAVIAVILGN